MKTLSQSAYHTLSSRGNLCLEASSEFGEFFTKTHHVVFRYIYGLHNGPLETVEDLTAETYLRAWKSRQRFKGDEDAALGWLLTIARNLIINNNRRPEPLPLDEETENQVSEVKSVSPETSVLQDEQHQILRNLLQNLPIDQREILILRYLFSWRVKDIALRLDMPENTVSVYIGRAIQHLRANWPQS